MGGPRGRRRRTWTWNDHRPAGRGGGRSDSWNQVTPSLPASQGRIPASRDRSSRRSDPSLAGDASCLGRARLAELTASAWALVRGDWTGRRPRARPAATCHPGARRPPDRDQVPASPPDGQRHHPDDRAGPPVGQVHAWADPTARHADDRRLRRSRLIVHVSDQAAHDRRRRPSRSDSVQVAQRRSHGMRPRASRLPGTAARRDEATRCTRGHGRSSCGPQRLRGLRDDHPTVATDGAAGNRASRRRACPVRAGARPARSARPSPRTAWRTGAARRGHQRRSLGTRSLMGEMSTTSMPRSAATSRRMALKRSTMAASARRGRRTRARRA